jgi:hypothetical protein
MQPQLGGLVFADDEHWQTLIKLTKYQLPKYTAPLDAKAMKLWLERMDKNEKWHREVFSCTLEEFMDMNPRWPLRAWVGLLLEATVGAH